MTPTTPEPRVGFLIGGVQKAGTSALAAWVGGGMLGELAPGARALFMAPRLLLADEPTGNLDQQTSAGIHALLKSLNQETNVTVIVVTHDPLLAAQMPVQLKVEAGRIFPLREEDGLLGGRLSAPGGEAAREA